jgi:hypothetical protein
MGSIIATVLKWTGLSQGVMELIAIGTVALGTGGAVWYWHHEVYDKGILAQQTADAKATSNVRAKADAQTAVLAKRATTAESTYAKSQSDLATYVAANPVHAGSVCIDSDHSGSHVSETPGAISGTVVTGTPATSVQSVPEGNPGFAVSQTQLDLLSALGASADQVGATLTEFQVQ